MVTVPTEQNRVGIASVTDAKFRAPDMSGGPLEAIGSGLQQLGHEAAAYAQHRQDLYDDATVRQADNELAQRIRERTLSGDNAFYKKTGSDAYGDASRVQADLTTARQEIAAKLRDPVQRQRFAEIADRRLNPEFDTIAKHADAQLEVYNNDQSKARLGLAADNAVTFADDPARFNEELGRVAAEVDFQAKGMPPEAAKFAHLKTVSGILTRVVDSKMTEDPVAAAAYYQEHKSQFAPGDAMAVEKALHGPLIERQGEAVASAAIASITGHGTIAPPAPVGGGTTIARMTAITLHSESRGRDRNADGSILTSSAGAQGRMQVMPGTNTDPGYGVTPARDGSDAERARVGRDYLAALMKHYGGDPAKAWAAYNGGPGRLDAAIAKHGSDWLNAMPAETRNYVRQNLGMLGGSTADVGYAPRHDDLNRAYQVIQDQHLPFEVEQAALTAIDKRVARDDRILSRQQEDAKDQAYRVITGLPDGITSINQIPPAVRQNLSPEALYSLTEKARENSKELAKQTQDLNAYRMAIGSPGFTWNPYDEQQRKAVEAGVKAGGGDAAAAFDVWQKTGILAKSGAVALRGGLVSTDPTHVRVAANIAGNMLRRNPNAFSGVEGGEDMERAALAFNHYTYDLGIDPAAAAARVAHENTPEFKTKIKIGEPELDLYRKQLRQVGADSASAALGGKFPTPGQTAEANETLVELTVTNMKNGYDRATAQAMARSQMLKVYGVSRSGSLRKYPPEKAYPPIGGSFDYIYKDAADTVKAETGIAATPNDVGLITIPGVTDDDIRNGRPARYRVLYRHTVNGQVVHDIVPGEFAVDTNAAVHATQAQRERDMRTAAGSIHARDAAALQRDVERSRYGGVRGG